MTNMKRNRPAAVKNIAIKDNFWSAYQELVRNTVLPYQWEVLNDRIPDAAPSHAVQNFRIAAGLEEGSFYGEVFQDSDLAKWLEAASYCLETKADSELEKVIDGVIDIIVAAQQENGYLDTYFTYGRQDKEWTNLYECHEMYCAGHMMEAAAAYYRATGKRKLLDAMCRLAGHIAGQFGEEEGKKRGYPGHQEIELALVKLYESAGKEEYLKLACYFLEERGKEPNYFRTEWETTRRKCTFKTDMPTEAPNLSYNQSHKRIYEQDCAVGHSVRAMYMYSAMADVAGIEGNEEMYQACRRLWEDVVSRQMYITGAIGATPTGEAFTFAYDLPNETAYAETCASIGLIFFAHRMQRMDMDGIYGDVMERALYNVVLGAMSGNGKEFFYVNPLEVWPEAGEKNPQRRHVKAVRQKWFGCACCPPNIARLLASLGQYIYSWEGKAGYGEKGSNARIKEDSFGSWEDILYVHLYIAGEGTIETKRGKYRVEQEGNYPWNEEIRLTIHEVPGENAKIALRIPGWCRNVTVECNGQPAKYRRKKGYAYLEEGGKEGDEIRLTFSMPVELMQANPKVRADAGKAAIQRGPVIYCLEQEDNGENLSALRLDAGSRMEVVGEAAGWAEEAGMNPLFSAGGLLEQIPVISAKGFRTVENNWEGSLYRPYALQEEEVTIKAVPYFLWGNRRPGEMLVWVRV